MGKLGQLKRENFCMLRTVETIKRQMINWVTYLHNFIYKNTCFLTNN